MRRQRHWQRFWVLALVIAAPSASRADPRGMRALVTGAAGFVGSHLVDRLLDQRKAVTALDKHPRLQRLGATRSTDLRLVQANLRSPWAAVRAARDCSVIYHLAGNSRVPRSIEDPLSDWQDNVHATLSVAFAATLNKVRRVVLVSSATVYGRPAGRQRVSETHAVAPTLPYGRSKLSAEYIVRAFAKRFDFELAVVRPFNIYGPRQTDAVIPQLVRQLRAEPGMLTFEGHPHLTRDFLHVSDAVAGLTLLGGCDLHTAPPRGVFNMSSGRAVTLQDLATKFTRAMGSDNMTVRFGERHPNHVDWLVGDSARLHDLGWKPRVSLEPGLADVVRRLAKVR